MRRHEKEITSQGELEQILWQGQVCHLAIPDDPLPYLIPLNYGYHDGALYFHSAPHGHKMTLFQRHPLVSFSVVIDLGIIEAELACNWGARFRSVAGSGRIEFIEDSKEKLTALRLLMAQYSDKSFTFDADRVAATAIYKLVIASMTGKQSRI